MHTVFFCDNERMFAVISAAAQAKTDYGQIQVDRSGHLDDCHQTVRKTQQNKRIKATDNPSLAFICFVEMFVVALLSVYARMPDFANNACK